MVMKTVILKNTTGSAITIRGRVIAASGQRDFADFDPRLLSEDETNISALIDAGDLIVNNGTSDLSAVQGKAWVYGSTAPVVFYSEAEGSSSTSSSGWKPKLAVTFTASAAEYIVEWYAEVKSTDSGTRVKTRVQEGGSDTYHETDWHPETGDNVGYGPVSGFKKVIFTAGSKTIDFDYCSSQSGKSVYMRKARIKVMEIT